MKTNRRRFIAGATALATTAALPRFAIASPQPIRVGIMLPFTGVYASLGHNITDAMMMRIQQAGGKLGGRPVEYVRVDSEAAPAKAVDNATKLVRGRGVDFVVGPVHSGVAMAMSKVLAKTPQTMMIIPNAGADELTRAACAPNIFRTSFSNWQVCQPMGVKLAKRGYKRVVCVTWKYAAGQQMVDAFAEGYEQAGGGRPLEKLWVDFPDIEFQAILTRIAALEPDAVFAFFSGTGSVKFVRDYDAAIDRARIPLFGAGFLTEGSLEAQGAAAEGIVSTLHWAETIDSDANRKFMADFQKTANRPADVFAVQGYDTGSLLIQAMEKVDGDNGDTALLVKALEGATIEGPRGAWRMSAAHNPIQDIYLRRAEGGINRVLGIAAPQLEDPGTGCNLSRA